MHAAQALMLSAHAHNKHYLLVKIVNNASGTCLAASYPDWNAKPQPSLDLGVTGNHGKRERERERKTGKGRQVHW